MAKLIKISPTEKRMTIHEVQGIGTSARKKHSNIKEPPEEFFAVRLLKGHGDGTEFYVEMSRAEAAAVWKDLGVYLRQDIEFVPRRVVT